MRKKKESHLTSRGKGTLKQRGSLSKGTEVGRDPVEYEQGSCGRKGLWSLGNELKVSGRQKGDFSVLTEWRSVFCPPFHTSSLEDAFLFHAFFHVQGDMRQPKWNPDNDVQHGYIPQHTQGNLWLGDCPSSRSQVEVTCSPVIYVHMELTAGSTYHLLFSLPLSSHRASESFSTLYSRLPFLITQRGKGVNK